MSWALYESNGTGEWRQIPKLKTLVDAANYIIEAEAIFASHLVLEARVCTYANSDDEAIEQFEHRGIRTRYVIKRIDK
jgi:hypothetical protein